MTNTLPKEHQHYLTAANQSNGGVACPCLPTPPSPCPVPPPQQRKPCLRSANQKQEEKKQTYIRIDLSRTPLHAHSHPQPLLPRVPSTMGTPRKRKKKQTYLKSISLESPPPLPPPTPHSFPVRRQTWKPRENAKRNRPTSNRSLSNLPHHSQPQPLIPSLPALKKGNPAKTLK